MVESFVLTGAEESCFYGWEVCIISNLSLRLLGDNPRPLPSLMLSLSLTD